MKTSADTRLRMRCGSLSCEDGNALLDDFAELEAQIAEARELLKVADPDSDLVSDLDGWRDWITRRDAWLAKVGR